MSDILLFVYLFLYAVNIHIDILVNRFECFQGKKNPPALLNKVTKYSEYFEQDIMSITLYLPNVIMNKNLVVVRLCSRKKS